ncbi:MAG: DNA topoisomerase 4 subunit A [Lachnospiraceae bacterium]|nr:DNA topoisomerase 4 subunit A [Lachnospiraceae bacterium]
MPQTERVIRTEYSEIMQKSYIDYAMSVIIARALPDIRDGLKPVQRRTLYDMHELGVHHNGPYRKSARIVGDTMGKYHPHGDSSIYDAMVVMAQDFKKGLPLVDGHGNFGSIEGDDPAAMRYTEARLSKAAEEAFLSDLDKDVVDFVPNYDETENEPSVLPARVPNLLINGAEGIAVGMATSIPPHNFGEVVDACIAYMKNPTISLDALMELLPGPDFPTGGVIVNRSELREIYETGMGKIRIRGRMEVEKGKGGRTNLVITEIPYTMIGSGIGKFLNDAGALVESRKTNDIVDISDQTSKEGIRIAIEVKKGADVEALKKLLLKKTRLEDTFGVNMLSVSDGKPETLGLLPIIRAHVNFRYELATRKYKNLLAKELEKKEIQEGLIGAIDVIDLIIEIIRGSKDVKTVKKCLTTGETTGIKFQFKGSEMDAKNLSFTEKQADAILALRLQKLVGLELAALKKQHEETLNNIRSYEDILTNRTSMAKVIMKDLAELRKEYGRERKTILTDAEEIVIEEKKVEERTVWFLMDRFGYARTIDEGTYERNKEAVEEENRFVFMCRNTDRLGLFTDTGQLHTIKILDLPCGKLRDKGTPVDNVSNFDSAKERLLLIRDMERLKTEKLLFATKKGMLKVVEGSEFDVTRRTSQATKLLDGDSLLFLSELGEETSFVMESELEYFLRIDVKTVPEKKKGAVGVRGMKLVEGDRLKACYLLAEGDNPEIEVRGKQVALGRLHMSGRDGKGVKR